METPTSGKAAGFVVLDADPLVTIRDVGRIPHVVDLAGVQGRLEL
jgi:hypothetical protein